MSAYPALRLLSTPFWYPQGRSPFSRAHLYFDRLELETGLFRKTRQIIPLREVRTATWSPLVEGATQLEIVWGKQPPLTLCLPEAQRWKSLLEHRIVWSHRPSRPLTPSRPVYSLKDAALFAATNG